jgi:preprotein translocase subunit YajC
MEQQAPLWVNMLPIILMFGVFYFFVIRPQQKQEAERKAMLAAVTKGDRVLTAGGIIGTIHTVSDDSVELKIAENVKVTVSRSYITAVLKDTPAPTPQKPS